MRILALGATGAIGTQMVELLASKGHEIHVTSRRARDDVGNVHYLQGNAKDLSFLNGILPQGWDAIVDFMAYDTALFRERVAAFLGATGQYVLLSSARVFAQSEGPITESSPHLLDVCQDATYLAGDEYALAKSRQEELLRASGQRNWTIVRPYITFGEARLQLGPLEKEGWLYRAQQGRSIVFCEPMLGKRTTLTNGRHVAEMIAALIGNPAALGEDFNLAGSQSITWDEVLHLYLEELETHLGHRPKLLLQDVAHFCEAARSVPQVIYDRMYDRRFDPAKIGAIVDLDGIGDCREALREVMRRQLSGGGFLALDSRGEALRDKAAGEHTALNAFMGTKQKFRYLAYRHVPLGLIRNMGAS